MRDVYDGIYAIVHILLDYLGYVTYLKKKSTVYL